MHRQAESPVSFAVNVMRLPKTGLTVAVEADAAARVELARLHDLLEVKAWRADLTVEPWKRNGVSVAGRVMADIVQECVVTLEPLEAHVDEPVEALFLPAGSKLGREGFDVGGEIMLDAEGPDSPELFEGDTVDVGALAEQFFGLGIDPYPKKPGAALPAGGDAEGSGPLADKLRRLLSRGD